MESVNNSLSEHPLAQGLSAKHLEVLAECASFAHFTGGKMIFREGESAEYLYLLLKGSVALEVFCLQPGPITLQTIKAGDVLGWSWLVPPYRWRFDARAVENTVALALDAEKLRAKCDEDKELGYELLKRFVTLVMDIRLQATRQQLVAHSSH